ncbi:arsenate reductase (glutaredoxin) [Echinicola marina]|uniref:arsenate reductase (glutaredoxin) n=1 Tax=Echinicola marina TaxID=2859768 RepID=UPI001CF619E7|nr:arsenate reductase (glutaredoxin) [Echinicola marina]UCS91614.1 arsenate reductase (glutaredoxin) [Echinicola marina]
MSKVKVYHNPRCGKSRNSLKLVQEQIPEDEVEIIKYLETPPSRAELKSILGKLGIKAEELIRENEQVWKESYKGKSFSEDELVEIMVENPILIERPIVVKGNKAVIGRPPENVLGIL